MGCGTGFCSRADVYMNRNGGGRMEGRKVMHYTIREIESETCRLQR